MYDECVSSSILEGANGCEILMRHGFLRGDAVILVVNKHSLQQVDAQLCCSLLVLAVDERFVGHNISSLHNLCNLGRQCQFIFP